MEAEQGYEIQRLKVFKKVQQNCVPPAVSQNVIGVNLILLQVGSTSLTLHQALPTLLYVVFP
jgi:hypothetical protein